MRRLSTATCVFFGCALMFFLTISKADETPLDSEESKLQFIDIVNPDQGTVDLEPYLWRHRLIVLFADSPNNPLIEEQIELLLASEDELLDRDIVVLSDTDPLAKTPLRQKLRPRGFVVILIGKDGEVKFRKPFPWSVREISRAIDKMPLRQLELQSK